MGQDEVGRVSAKAKMLAARWHAKGVMQFHVDVVPGATGEQVIDALLKVEDWLDDPVNNLVSRLEGEAFLHHDAAHATCEITETGIVKLPQTAEQKRDQRLGDLLHEAADMLAKLSAALAQSEE